MPFGLEQLADRNLRDVSHVLFAQPTLVLPVEAQLRLRELHQYVDFCRTLLDDMSGNLALLESNPDDLENLHKVSERLKQFCLEADSWGFSALYQVGTGLQVLLLDAGSRMREQVFWETLNRGLAMLSALLEQCESDFRWRLAVADTLDSIDELFYT